MPDIMHRCFRRWKKTLRGNGLAGRAPKTLRTEKPTAVALPARAVLARETSLAQIKDLSNNCDIELETFAHGALCMSFSGI